MPEQEFLKEFGFRLKMSRMKRGFTQAQLGEMVEISEHRISQIENGKCNITLKSVSKIFDALGISFEKWFNF